MEEIQLSLFGKTYPEPSPQTKERTSESSSKSSAKLKTVTPIFLDLRTEKENALGLTQGGYWETDTPLLGESSTLNFGASPKDAEESLLSQILEDNAPEKYYLSATACKGILRRAANRGKELPPILKEALLQQIARSSASENDADVRGGKGCLIQEDKTNTLATSNDQFIVAYDARGNGDGATSPTITGDHNNRVTDYTTVVVEGNDSLVCLCDQGGERMDILNQMTTPLRANAGGHQPVVVLEGNGQRPSHRGDGYAESEVQYTLNSTEVHGVAYGIGRDAFNQGQNAKFGMSIDEEVQPPIIAKGPGGGCVYVE